MTKQDITWLPVLGVLGGLGLTAAPAAAQPPGYTPPGYAPAQLTEPLPTRQLKGLSVSATVHAGWRFDDARDLFDREGGDGGGGLEVTYDLLPLGSDTRLAVGGGLSFEGYASASEAAIPAELRTDALFATAIARFRDGRTWQPYVGLAAGVERGTLTLNPGPGAALESEALSGFARGSLGLRIAPAALVWKTRQNNPILALALAVEAAGTLGTGFDFELSPEPPSQGAGDSDGIAVDPVPLGSLGSSGAFGRLLFTAIF